jgi:hypothetical protein
MDSNIQKVQVFQDQIDVDYVELIHRKTINRTTQTLEGDN